MTQFAHIEYSIDTTSLDIFSYGCDSKICEGCFNSSLWNWDKLGMSDCEILQKIQELIDKYGVLISRIFLLGGDPVDAYLHDSSYLDFALCLRTYKKPIYLFTRYEVNQIPKKLAKVVDYIKTGNYRPEWTTEDNIQYGIKLATYNQKIYKVNEEIIKQCH